MERKGYDVLHEGGEDRRIDQEAPTPQTATRIARKLDVIQDLIQEHEETHGELFRRAFLLKLEELSILLTRHLKYGPRNIANPPPGIEPELALLVRMTDKLARVSNLVRTGAGAEAADEFLEDSWADAANYSTIGGLVSAGLWPYVAPLAERQGGAA